MATHGKNLNWFMWADKRSTSSSFYIRVLTEQSFMLSFDYLKQRNIEYEKE